MKIKTRQFITFTNEELVEAMRAYISEKVQQQRIPEVITNGSFSVSVDKETLEISFVITSK